MRVKDLFESVAWEDVAEVLLMSYPDLSDADPVVWKRAFEAIRDAVPDDSPECRETTVVIRHVRDEEEEYWDVSGRVEGDEQTYGLELSSFSQWAAYQFDTSVLQMMTPAEAAAHILWEATFFGFTDEEIAAEREELKRRVEEFRQSAEACRPIEVDDPRLEPFCSFLAEKRPCPIPVKIYIHWDCDVVENPETGEKGFGAYVEGGDFPEIHVAGLLFADDPDGGIAAVAELLAHEYAHHVQVWYGEEPDEEAASRLAEEWRREFFGEVDQDPGRDG